VGHITVTQFFFKPANFICRPMRTWSRDSSVGIMLGYGLGDGFEYRQEVGIFLFTTASRPAPGPTQRPIQCVPGALSHGGKMAGAWSSSLSSSVEVKECVGLYLHFPNTPSWRGAQLKTRKKQEQLYLFICELGSHYGGTALGVDYRVHGLNYHDSPIWIPSGSSATLCHARKQITWQVR
jgi:hypothetical protein